jgi:sulfur carrier protein
MKILVNGTSHEVSAETLADALPELGYRDAVVATALNGKFVAAQRRSNTALSEHDRVEIVVPMQGG